MEHVLAVCDADRSYVKVGPIADIDFRDVPWNLLVVEDANALILRCDSENSRRTWQSYLQGAIYRASGATPVTGLIETLSDSEESEVENHDSVDASKMEKFFLTGVLDELKISFSYSSLHDPSFMKLLLAEEKRLLEFRAIGGQVELSMRADDILIGTVLKALEIEDLVRRKGTSQISYLARSFIRNADLPSLLDNADIPTQPNSSDLKAPSFTRVAGLLPFDVTHPEAGQIRVTDALDSFVKAQIVIFDQNSSLYSNVDKQVTVTLSTLSFYCRRPTILAIMEFVNAINTLEDNSGTLTDTSSPAVASNDVSKEIVNDGLASARMEEPVVKSILGKGKSRVIFYLLLNMARAEIFLMKENDSKLATLTQDNFLTDIKLVFCSYNADDEDYEGYDYSLQGELSEVRIVYLNRFVQEVISFLWVLFLVIPRMLSNYLKLDVVQITVQNTFKWFGGSKTEINAVHVDILKILVEDINLNVGSGSELGESIIQDVKGVSFVIRRSLRDLVHQIPSLEVAVTRPQIVPLPRDEVLSPSIDVVGHTGSQALDPAKAEMQARGAWVATKVSVHINMVELCLHYGVSRDASLATLQVSGVWLLYKSNMVGEGFLSATLKDLVVVDDREGTEKELKLAFGKPDLDGHNPSQSVPGNMDHNTVESNPLANNARKYTPAILILDARFHESSTFISLCIQRPQLLVALDFLLAVVEFFVPTVRSDVSNDENANSSHFLTLLYLTNQFSAKPLLNSQFHLRNLGCDDEGLNILYMMEENGAYLDSCILLGANSCYSADENDNVFLEGENGSPSDRNSGRSSTTHASQSAVSGRSTELIFELQKALFSFWLQKSTFEVFGMLASASETAKKSASRPKARITLGGALAFS
ncbi:UNVERIFIED_CONTAM: hypothetical protein Sradi_1863600 [Sesamum radiatum]|uniref:PH domain-containing protein n=1 Tax=Sesamum radiatum TaxID=300843 RepID=A0AAW2TXL7_SESRA